MKQFLTFLIILGTITAIGQPITQRASSSLTTADGRLMWGTSSAT